MIPRRAGEPIRRMVSSGSAGFSSYQGITFPTNPFDPGQWGLRVATSPDGVAWTKYPGNPVVDFTQAKVLFGDPQPCWPLALTVADSGFTGYIAAGVVDIYSGASNPNVLRRVHRPGAGHRLRHRRPHRPAPVVASPPWPAR
jgi:hypothetical protein